MSEQLRALLDDLGRQRAELLAQSAPLKAKRAELLEKIQPLEAELREVNQKVKLLEQPKLGELLQSISGIETALGIANGMRPCCADVKNRVLAERAGAITVEQCSVCGRRHHTLEADPIELGVKGAPVG